MNTSIKLIAETAWHHEGDLKFVKELLDAIVNQSKADIIKFHITLDFNSYMSKHHTLYEKLKNWLFDEIYWQDLIVEIQKQNKNELMLLYNDIKAVEFGTQFNPSLVELHSACLNDFDLLDALKNNVEKKTKVVLGVGGSSLYEIESAINYLQHPEIVLMFGFQNYPTEYSSINFSKMRKIMKMFPNFSYGYADHTAWDEPNNVLITLFGAALGMNYIEKHVTTRYGEKRVDQSSAINIEMFNDIKNKLIILDACNGDGLLKLNNAEKDYSIFGPMKKAAILMRDAERGDILSRDNLCFKRTDQISDLSQIEVMELVGTKFFKTVKAGHVLQKSFFLKDSHC